MRECCGSRSSLQMKKDRWGAEEELEAGVACGVHVEGSTKYMYFEE